MDPRELGGGGQGPRRELDVRPGLATPAAKQKFEDQERPRIRALLAEQGLEPRRSSQSEREFETAPALRIFVRRALFCASPGAEDLKFPLTTIDMNGEISVLGKQLLPADLRVFCYIVREKRAEHKRSEQVSELIDLPVGRVTRAIRGPASGSKEKRAIAESLDRLANCRWRFGEPDKPQDFESFLIPHSRTRYTLGRRFHSELVQAITNPRAGGLEFTLDWRLLCKLNGRALRLWAYLECERWDTKKHKHRIGDHTYHSFTWALRDPFLRIFGFDQIEPTRRQHEIDRVLRVIYARDGRYGPFILDAESLTVRRDVLPSPDDVWLGKLCRHCLARQTRDECCCRAAAPCREPDCWRCASYKASVEEEPRARLRAV